jgi:hypothetical protein
MTKLAELKAAYHAAHRVAWDARTAVLAAQDASYEADTASRAAWGKYKAELKKSKESKNG